jgi:GTPase Era involved in 16S rRNA processing
LTTQRTKRSKETAKGEWVFEHELRVAKRSHAVRGGGVCAANSRKKILVGENGAMVAKIAGAARLAMEGYFKKRVHLFVKVAVVDDLQVDE